MIKVDQSKSTDINKKYQVTAVPTVVILKNGAVVWQKTGMIDEKLLKEKLDEMTSSRP
jgi:thioredoxin-like negative regulator of GroEL